MNDPKDFVVFDTNSLPIVQKQKQNIQILKAVEKRERKNQKRLKSWTGSGKKN